VYNGGVMHEEEQARKTIEQTLQLAEWTKGAGTVAINVNPSPKPNRGRKTDAELDTQARALNRLGSELRVRGMKLLIHHHDPELMENAREWKHIVKNTDPKLVSFCVDVHWVLRGGHDPAAFVREALPRTGSYHLRNSKQGVWLEELADGDVDYRTIAADFKKAKFSGYLVVELAYEKETQITRPLEENLKRSRLWAERVFR
jgi:inosose dehydratase